MGCGTGSGHPFIFQAYCDINWRNREITVRWEKRNKKVNRRDDKKRKTLK